MKLTLVIPTFNRSQSLARTLRSVFALTIPDEHGLDVVVADNNSSDDTLAVVSSLRNQYGRRLAYVIADAGQGRSYALNAGIQSSQSDLIGFIDDDEELEGNWAQVAFEALADASIDYIGGRCVPVWPFQPPLWLDHPQIRTAIGWADFGPEKRSFEDPTFDALPLGGNSVFRRTCFRAVGLFSEALGRRGERLLGAEDTDMYERVKAAGIHGMYLPDLVVRHHIPAARLTKRYMRRWAFWTSVSNGHIFNTRPTAGPLWFGLPRHMYGRLLRTPSRWLHAWCVGEQPEVFHHELTFWRFAGFYYGVHLLSSVTSPRNITHGRESPS